MSSDQLLEQSDARLGALLRLAHEKVEHAVFERIAAAGHPSLRPAHFRLLRFPGIDGVRPTELAARLNSTKQAINPVLNDLERWRYIQRHQDPEDGRGRVVRLTPMGRDLMATITAIHREIEADLARHAGKRRFDAAIAVLREINDQLPSDANAATDRALAPTRFRSERTAATSGV